MATRYFGERIKRNEDPRLLTGQALYVDDVDLPDMLHAAFLRSPYAHARLDRIDVSRALEHEGVVAVYTAQDLGDYWKPGPLLVSPPPVANLTFNERTQVPLAKDKVRFAGDPVVMVLAESRYGAEDALADIEKVHPQLSLSRCRDAAQHQNDEGDEESDHRAMSPFGPDGRRVRDSSACRRRSAVASGSTANWTRPAWGSAITVRTAPS